MGFPRIGGDYFLDGAFGSHTAWLSRALRHDSTRRHAGQPGSPIALMKSFSTSSWKVSTKDFRSACTR